MKLLLLSLLGITRAQSPEAFAQNGKCAGEYYRRELKPEKRTLLSENALSEKFGISTVNLIVI